MNNTISRRGVLRGAVWGVPAVTFASASPAFATSTPTVPPVKPPKVIAECMDTPGKWSKTVRLIVRLSPSKPNAFVKIGTLSAKYDKHYGYYVDVKQQPKSVVTIQITWTENKKPQSLVVSKKFDCSSCGNGRGGK